MSDSFEGFEAVLVEMTIAPGISLPEHRHPGFVLGYIAEGATWFGIDYESDQVFQSGGTFFEPAGAIHSTFGSASSDDAARVLLFMVVPRDAPLTSLDVPPRPAEIDRGNAGGGDTEMPGFR